MKIYIILLCFTLAFSLDCEGKDKHTKACPPSTTPVWPDQFEQTFDETMTYPIIGANKTKGKFFYDWISKSYRVDRDNGHYDRYCGSIYTWSNTPCSHIVTGGDRYLYFPEKKHCCYCCSDEHGCGVLKPNWLESASFEDFVNENNGRVFEKWNKPGLQNNFYFATADTRIMSRIDQQPNDIQDFDVNSFHLGITDPSVFNLPSICKKTSTCAFLSVCTAVRAGKKLRFLQDN
jgi:hypothetical protein